MIRRYHYIADAAEAKEIDKISIQEIGIPSLVLMEKASMAVAACVRSYSKTGSLHTTMLSKDISENKAAFLQENHTDLWQERVLAVCGTGNNGGDGVAAARLLWESGYHVSVLVLGQQEKCTREMLTQLSIADHLGIPILWDDFSKDTIGVRAMGYGGKYQAVTTEKPLEYSIIIDAIFGIGLSRPVSALYADWIEWINASPASVISVDIPSGIDASTGDVLGKAVKADVTITFGVNKRGLALYPGMQYAGEVVVADIGFPEKAVCQVDPKAYTYAPENISLLLPRRKPRSNKGSYGRVLIIAGSPQMSGACYFAAEAAYRVGCGLVQVFTAKENAVIVRTKLPEAIVSTWSEGITEEEAVQIKAAIRSASAVVIGPGLGQSKEALSLVKLALDLLCKREQNREDSKPLIMDADALNLLAGMEEYFEEDGAGRRRINLPPNVILTPHLKEMSRLIQWKLSDIASHMVTAVQSCGEGCTIVLKDARTLVSDGDKIYINTTGNHALAKGGSGDVLSGMIGGLSAQGMSPMEAASLAVCLHGMTADAYVQRNGRHTMLASDILAEIPNVMK